MTTIEGRIQERLCVVRLRVSAPDGWSEDAPTEDISGGPTLEAMEMDDAVDTGAMVSAIPASALERLGCPSFGAVAFQSVLGPHDQGNQVVGSYAASLALPDLIEVKWLRVLGVSLDTALLGMDVLEHLVLEVDGPRGTFRLTRR